MQITSSRKPALLRRLVAFAFAVLMAAGLFAVPAFASPQLYCSKIITGSSTYTVTLPTDCGGGSLLSGGYHNIRLDIYAACDSVVYNSRGLYLQINGDTGAHYDWEYNGPPPIGGGGSSNQTAMDVGDMPCQTTSDAPHGGSAFSLFIPGAENTYFNKLVLTTVAGQGTWTFNEIWAGSWHKTTNEAISQLTFTVEGGSNYVAGTQFDLFIE